MKYMQLHIIILVRPIKPLNVLVFPIPFIFFSLLPINSGINSDSGSQGRLFSLRPTTVFALEGIFIAGRLRPVLLSPTRMELIVYYPRLLLIRALSGRFCFSFIFANGLKKFDPRGIRTPAATLSSIRGCTTI